MLENYNDLEFNVYSFVQIKSPVKSTYYGIDFAVVKTKFRSLLELYFYIQCCVVYYSILIDVSIDFYRNVYAIDISTRCWNIKITLIYTWRT